jgi:hypothetical protein
MQWTVIQEVVGSSQAQGMVFSKDFYTLNFFPLPFISKDIFYLRVSYFLS